jgi:hypothetical protein
LSEESKPAFEPFITVSLACVRQPYERVSANKIAVVSNAPGVTAVHMYGVPEARRLVDELNKLIAVLDPPPVTKLAVLVPDEKPKRKRAVKRTGRIKRRKA